MLGTSALLLFLTMLTVTPLHTLTGWRWHLVLRRDYGIAMFAVAALDLVLAATTTGRTFPGGFLTRVSGHTFLAAGTLAQISGSQSWRMRRRSARTPCPLRDSASGRRREA